MRRAQALLAVVAGTVLAGCHGSQSFLEVPRLDDQSLLLARFDPGVDLQAFELGTEPYVGVPLEDFATLYVARYRCSLASLGMEAGAQDLGTGELFQPLPESPRVSRAELGRSELEPISPWPEALAQLRVRRAPDPAPCRSFDLQRFPLVSPRTDPVRLLLPLPEGRALVLKSSGEVLTLGPEGPMPYTALSTSADYLGGFLTRSGRLLLTRGQRSATATLEGAWTPGPPIDDVSLGSQQVAADPDGDLEEAFMVGETGRFFHYDGSRWQRYGDEPPPEAERFYDVLWLGPGRGVACGIEPDALTTWDHGVLGRRLLPPFDVGDYAVGMTQAEGIGLVVGTKLGNLLLESGDNWIKVQPQFQTRVRQVLPFSGGLIFGGRSGTFQQYYNGYGLCESIPIASDNTTHTIIVGDRLLMVSKGEVGTEETLNIATPRPIERLGCQAP